MAVRDIIRMGHPLLRETAARVPDELIASDWLDALITDLGDTLEVAGGIGLAAPQIGESWQVAIVDIPGGEGRYGDMPDFPFHVFVNPQIEVLDATPAGLWEGCLSVPGLRGYVLRPQHVLVRYHTPMGQAAELDARDFLATVLQHEFDHLAGRLYVDHLKDPRLLAFEEEFLQFHLGAEPVEPQPG